MVKGFVQAAMVVKIIVLNILMVVILAIVVLIAITRILVKMVMLVIIGIMIILSRDPNHPLVLHTTYSSKSLGDADVEKISY